MPGLRWTVPVVLLACLAPLACAGPRVAPVPTSEGERKIAIKRTIATGVVTGTVLAPAGLIARRDARLVGSDGASLVGSDGASLVGSDGGSLIGGDGAGLIGLDGAGATAHLAGGDHKGAGATAHLAGGDHKGAGATAHLAGGGHKGAGAVGARKLQAAAGTPLAGTEVYLAFAEGTAVPGLPHAVTNAEGQYRITGVPAGHPYVVVARFADREGNEGKLLGMARAIVGEAKCTVDGASTMVATAMLEGTQGPPGDFDPPTYERSVAKVAQSLETAPAPDWTKPASVLGQMAENLEDQPALAADVQELKADAAKPATSAFAIVRDIATAGKETQIEQAAESTAGTKGSGFGDVTPAPATPDPAILDPIPPDSTTTPPPVTTSASEDPPATASPTPAPTDPPATPEPIVTTPTPGPVLTSAPTAPPSQDPLPPNDRVAPVAGDPDGRAGDKDGQGDQAAFEGPYGLHLQADGTAFASDANGRLRHITPGGVVTTFGSAADLTSPRGLVYLPGRKRLLVADAGRHCIYAYNPAALQAAPVVFAGIPGSAGSVLGAITGKDAAGRTIAIPNATTSKFRAPGGICATSTHVYFSDAAANAIYSVNLATNTVSLLVGAPGPAGFQDSLLGGKGTDARLSGPSGMAITQGNDGFMVVADTGNHRVRLVALNGGYTRTLAGSGQAGFADDSALKAKFNRPIDVAYWNGSLLVADQGNHLIRAIGTEVTPFLGLLGVTGNADGALPFVRFGLLTGLASNGTTLYIADGGNHRVRKLGP